MNILISLLEKELDRLNNAIVDSQTIPAKIDSILPKFNSDDILSLTFDDFNFIKSLNSMNLSNSELNFLQPIFSSNENIKNVLKEIGFDDRQKAIILNIKRKIETIKTHYLSDSIENVEHEVEHCKLLISQIKNNRANIIADLEYIKNILDNSDITDEEKTNIYMLINESNTRFYNSFSTGHDIDSQDDYIDESELNENNLDEEKVKEIFEKYSIKYEEINQKLKLKLLKYGDYENIEQVLDTLKSNRFENLFDKYDILIRILVYSTSDDIIETIWIAKQEGIFRVLKSHPSILFPEAREVGKTFGGGGHGGDKNITGARNKFRKNIEILKQIGVPVKQAEEKCSTIFVTSTKTLINSINNLRLYGIKDFSDTEHVSLKVLCGSGQIDRLDVAIECGLYDYSINNLSSILDNRVNFYRVKYCEKLRNSGDTQAPSTPFRILNDGTQKLELSTHFNSICKNSPYGNKKEDTFELYDAIEPVIQFKDVYAKVLELNEANQITQLSINHPIIKSFDSQYKIDNLRYSFNGVIISRYKVIRYFELLASEPNIEVTDDLLLYIITKDSMLDQRELDVISKCIGAEQNVRRLVR